MEDILKQKYNMDKVIIVQYYVMTNNDSIAKYNFCV